MDSSQLFIHGEANITDYSCGLFKKNSALEMAYQVKADTLFIDKAKIQLPVSAFDCGDSRMNRDFKEALKAKEYPYLSLQLEYVVQNEHDTIALVAITIAKTRRYFEIPFHLRAKGQNKYWLTAKQKMKMSDFHIQRPTAFFGLIQAYDPIEIEINLKLFIPD